ncbi:hypothetical protein WN55_01750 [Dufourea novaeangliae]|uniref:Uncharacterized protein n=1 Tax=Dufourea novaeangliae TaxID=178035 RepID=A0A154PDY4_DUFNO|nr:hypothetical protein WN55_01750 [Dufourea novaeangliae]
MRLDMRGKRKIRVVHSLEGVEEWEGGRRFRNNGGRSSGKGWKGEKRGVQNEELGSKKDAEGVEKREGGKREVQGSEEGTQRVIKVNHHYEDASKIYERGAEENFEEKAVIDIGNADPEGNWLNEANSEAEAVLDNALASPGHMTKIELELQEAPEDANLVGSISPESNVTAETNSTYSNGELKLSEHLSDFEPLE